MASGRGEAPAAFGFLLALGQGSDSRRALESGLVLKLGGDDLGEEQVLWPPVSESPSG